jgi:hypothetical protein
MMSDCPGPVQAAGSCPDFFRSNSLCSDGTASCSSGSVGLLDEADLNHRGVL